MHREQFGLSPSAVTRRIKQLEENNVIVGYRLDLNLSKLGMTFFKAQLYLRKHQDTEIAKLRAYCAEHPHITYLIEQLGECKLEVELEVNDYEQCIYATNDLNCSIRLKSTSHSFGSS